MVELLSDLKDLGLKVALHVRFNPCMISTPD